MKSIHYLLIFLGVFMSNSISAQDTVRGRINTLICSEFTPELYFQSVYDTASYNSKWFMFGEDVAFSDLDSIIINNIDSLLLYSVPNSDPDSLYIDTLYFSIRFTPEINFEVPVSECFDGDSLIIKELTNTFGDYTTVDYELEGEEQFASMDSIIKVFVGNGDSTALIVNYFTFGCSSISDTIRLTTEFKPVPDFSSSLVCFGDSTIITNASVFDSTIASFSLEIEGLNTFNNTQDKFALVLPENVDQRNVFVEITEGNCMSRDTFVIQNKLVPIAIFDVEQTCENELLKILNQSTETTSNTTYEIQINNKSNTFSNAIFFTINDTIPNGVYSLLGITDNENGCIDSFEILNVEIDSVTYVSFTGLDDEYCESQDFSNLQANISAGQFQGQFIEDAGGGQATFTPTSPATSIPITLTYTNTMQCTDSETQTVPVIHPKPQLVLDGLEDAYCELDPASGLILTDTLENAVSPLSFEFEIIKDGQLFDTEESLTYNFDPLSFGSYTIINTYTDNNGCFDIITNTTTVNPLPIVEVDSLIVITPGETIIIGNLAGTETNVNYSWSDGSVFSTLDIDQPGIYILQAMNSLTGCEASDTAKVEYDVSIETDLVQIQISPNPTQDLLNISIEKEVQNILLVDVLGEPVSLNGSKTFNTNMQGELKLDLSNQGAGYYYLIIPNVGNFLIVKL